jgi:hypothetical protein
MSSILLEKDFHKWGNFVETNSHYVAQAGLELTIFLPPVTSLAEGIKDVYHHVWQKYNFWNMGKQMFIASVMMDVLTIVPRQK